jgi:hypothetical protein
MPPRCNVKAFRGSRPGLDAKRGLAALLLFVSPPGVVLRDLRKSCCTNGLSQGQGRPDADRV